MRRLALPILLAFVAATAQAADQATYSISLAGFRLGTLSLRSDESAGTYKAQSQVRSTGLTRGLYPADITASVTGQVSGNTYNPQIYIDESKSRGETKRTRIRYVAGVPQIEKDPPDTRRRSWHANPEEQGGTVDMLTAGYAILRDQPEALACKLDVSPYDGRERTRIRMAGGTRDGDTLVCPGMYTRVAGFSPKEMAEKVNWPFTVTYRSIGDGMMRVEQVRLQTTLGRVTIDRR
ncbi:DUF3108 domain-containing protein [Tropicimonas sp. IMCC34043]|uniref:DUF3108 domain-containing protein n=1 Tax=Tropicimonas sp. IMCC34043 TaxID=2248760 RepID=UPI0013003958|nr:DUF3108 domain-containing protein [Tropicimonas sp. IMCC34043]